MEFREVLQRERKARGWNQEYLAEQVQVSRQAVSKWETGDAMPDLNKLLALAAVLNISLDELCGREPPLFLPAAQEELPQPPAQQPSRFRWLWPVVCGILALCLLVGGMWAWERRDYVPAEEAPAKSSLPDTFEVSGVGFSGQSDYRVSYQFTPSIASENFTYQITFTNSDGNSFTFDALYSGGVCSGVAHFDRVCETYAVTVSVSDGINTRNLAVAQNLKFFETYTSWTPLKESS